MKKLKLLIIIIFIIISILLAFVIGFFMLRLFITKFAPREPLEVSAPDTVSLVWEFYACGNDCPYYRALFAEKEENAKYVGQMVDLRGFDVWSDYSADDENAESKFMAKAVTDKFVCTGRFERYYKNPFWECCMDDSDNLVFQADECRQEPRTYEERCRHNRWIFESFHKRSLAALPREAEAGDAEAQYLLGDIYEQGIPCHPQDNALAEYWYGRAADQGHEFAIQSLERMRRADEE